MKPAPAPMTQVLKGVPAAPGLASGSAVIWTEESYTAPRYAIDDRAGERQRLDAARSAAREELRAIQEKVNQETKSGEAEVFSAHRMFLDDPALLQKIYRAIETNALNAEASWMDAIEAFASQLEQIPDPSLSARAADIRDVGLRVLRHLMGRPTSGLHLEAPAVILAKDLTPSQTASLEKDKVLAFCTAEGGPTSHTAILAKALGLPAVVALGADLLTIPAGSLVLVDGNRGDVVVQPDEKRWADFQIVHGEDDRRKQKAAAAAFQPAVTLDGVRVEVVANIGGWEDAKSALAFGAEGVGLFRTEFLYLDRTSLPSEEEQVNAYRPVFEAFGSQPIVVRTLDIGGDKAVSYLGMPQEANPFLGWRAFRMADGKPEIFLSQLRALLRAGAGRDVRIMIPMISSYDEVLQAKDLLEQARRSLDRDGMPYADRVQFGIMVEVPSAALLSNDLAPHLDFFSIGTNDLTQYTLAVDRTNSRVSHLASPFHPAVLRLIQLTIQSAHAHSCWVGMCGELAGEVKAVPLLLGLGLNEFSMAPALIPAVKAAIRKCSQKECQEVARQALSLSTPAAVIDLLTEAANRFGF